MTKLPDPIREALTAGHLAHLVTINPDGSPHVTIVWIGVEGDEIVSGHIPFHRKLRNVRQDPRVSLSVELGGHNEMGLANYLVVEGGPRGSPKAPTTPRPATSCGSPRTASAAPA
jgi:PPOX class probable F420-dependent enzyme